MTDEHSEVDFTERLYRLFLSDMHFVNDNSLLRSKEEKLAPYNENLDTLLAAGALYGVARRLGLVVQAYERNCAEELALRQALRGKTHNSMVNDIENKPLEDVKRELAEHGYDDKKVRDIESEIRVMMDFYSDDDLDSADENEPAQEKLPKDAHLVTRIDALFKITRPDGLEQCVTYCRAHTKAAGSDDSVLAWYSTNRFDEEPAYDFNLVFELQGIQDAESYRTFLKTIAGLALWVKNGPHREEDVEGVVSLLELEADGKDTLGE